MADVSTIRGALATRIFTATGLRTLPEAKDQVSPPVAVILPGAPFIVFGATMDGAFTVNLRVLMLISDAAPDEKVQRALDAYLGIGAGVTASSLPAAIQGDPTLSGAVHFAVPVNVDTYNRVDYNGVTYFGARLNVSIGAILFRLSFYYTWRMARIQVPTPPPGARFGRLRVTKEVTLSISGHKIRGLEVICDCGTSFQTRLLYVTGGKTKSCGCLNKDLTAERNRTPEARERSRSSNSPKIRVPSPGTRFGRGTVVQEVRVVQASGRSVRGLQLQCDCGVIYEALLHNVIRGKSGSCGCLRRDLTTAANQTDEARARIRLGTPTHGLRNHPLYRTWHNMMNRCYSSRNKAYKYYGGRGITVCRRWHDVRWFIQDIEDEIGSWPSGLTLDRKNNDGNYEPGNVRWATPSEQVRNSRKCLGKK